jgi:hypothetical protein
MSDKKLLQLGIEGMMLMMIVGCNTPAVTSMPPTVAPTLTSEPPTVTPTLPPTEQGSGRIEGRVYLFAFKKIPFAGASVSLTDTTLSPVSPADPKALVAEVTTDEAGNFTFSEVRPGQYTLFVRAVLNELPGGISECPSQIYSEDWWIYSETTADGRLDISATLTTEFSVSTGDIVRYNLDFACG